MSNGRRRLDFNANHIAVGILNDDVNFIVTLLQGIQGLLLTVHVAAQKAAQGEDSKMLLDRALATADRIIIEGRNRVTSLRSEHLTDAELIGSIDAIGNDLKRDDSVEFHVKREGIDATLHAHVADEVFFIAREALTNAFRHAEASEITIEVNYGRLYFSLTCTDNGRGFDPECRQKAGHWGLTGLIERAQQLGGQLHVRSEHARGTQILFGLPSYRAYVGHSKLAFFLRTHHLFARDSDVQRNLDAWISFQETRLGRGRGSA